MPSGYIPCLIALYHIFFISEDIRFSSLNISIVNSIAPRPLAVYDMVIACRERIQCKNHCQNMTEPFLTDISANYSYMFSDMHKSGSCQYRLLKRTYCCKLKSDIKYIEGRVNNLELKIQELEAEGKKKKTTASR